MRRGLSYSREGEMFSQSDRREEQTDGGNPDSERQMPYVPSHMWVPSLNF